MAIRGVRIASLALALALAAGGAGAALAGTPPNPLIVPMHASGGGARDGSVSLFQINDTVVTNVILTQRIDNATAAIVNGTCAQPGKEAYALTSTVNGQSLTRLPNAQLADMAAGKHAIVVRKGGTRVACGEIAG